jgi:Predicted nucleotide-binding protein containing TIR-like domain
MLGNLNENCIIIWTYGYIYWSLLIKLRVFIGSSTEGLEIANAIQSNLEPEAEVRIWNQDAFLPGNHALESIISLANSSDFGIFVFSLDDLVEIRNSHQMTVRDNVVLELGISIGRLGSKRSFIVMPKNQNLRIPSDLLGINAATFDPDRLDGDLVAALGPVCTKIRKALKTPNDHPLEPDLKLPVLLRRQSLTPKMIGLLNFIETKDSITLQELSKHVNCSQSETHYRLEYLRLLSLINIDYSSFPDNPQIKPNPDYLAVCKELALPPRRAYSSTPDQNQ